MNKTRFLLLTPSFNAGCFLSTTFNSILEQSCSEVSITYILCDGLSTDSTQSLVNEYSSKFADVCIEFIFLSQKDSGMYDALSKGFMLMQSRPFDVYCYLNAGDWFAPRAFLNVATIFEKKPCINVISGLSVKYNSIGDLTSARLPGPYPRYLVVRGLFGGFLPCIQQESTFWRSAPHSLIDFNKLASCKLAGDFYLWSIFCSKFDIYVVSIWLSGFTVQPGQLSEIYRDDYFNELKSLSRRVFFWDYIYAFVVGLVWLIPDSFRKRLFKNLFYDV